MLISKDRLGSLDGLRGIAALLVVLLHEQNWFGPVRFPSAWLTVDMFFVLSGFVLAHAYGAKLSEGMTVSQFLMARIVRLYPLYAAGLAVAVATPLASLVFNGRINEAGIPALLTMPFSIFMLPTPGSASAPLFPLNVVAWSLLFELVVNIAYALTVKLWTPPRLLCFMALAGLELSSYDNYNQGVIWATFIGGFPRVFYSFAAGVLIFSLWSRNLKAPTVPAALFPPMLIGIIAAASFISILACILVFIPILVWLASSSEPKGCTKTVFSLLGASSYAVYTLHIPLMTLVNNAVKKLGVEDFPHLTGALFIAALIPLSIVLDRRFDRPLRRWVSAQLSLPRPSQHTGAGFRPSFIFEKRIVENDE